MNEWQKNPGDSALPPSTLEQDAFVDLELGGTMVDDSARFQYRQRASKWDWLHQTGVEILRYRIHEV